MEYVAAEQSVAAAAGHAAAHTAACGIAAVCVTARSTVSVTMQRGALHGSVPPPTLSPKREGDAPTCGGIVSPM